MGMLTETFKYMDVHHGQWSGQLVDDVRLARHLYSSEAGISKKSARYSKVGHRPAEVS